MAERGDVPAAPPVLEGNRHANVTLANLVRLRQTRFGNVTLANPGSRRLRTWFAYGEPGSRVSTPGGPNGLLSRRACRRMIRRKERSEDERRPDGSQEFSRERRSKAD